MRNIVLIFLITVISGCSVGSLELEKPIYEGHTDKNSDDYNKCLMPKWIDLWPTSSNIPTNRGYKIISADNIFGAYAIVKIEKAENGGSDITVYAARKGWTDHWGKTARSCM